MLKQALIGKIRGRSAHVAVIGLGYVGLPLSVAFADAGLAVTGIDVDPAKAATINSGASYVADVPDLEVARLVAQGRLAATTDFAALAAADAAVVCVPTPLRKTRDPDISYVVSAADEVARHAHQAMLVVLESTSYPGTTDEVNSHMPHYVVDKVTDALNGTPSR